MEKSFSHIALPDNAYLSCYPNASLLDIENSEFKYNDNAQYFGAVAEKLIEQGVRLIGVVVERHHNTFITLNPRCVTPLTC